MSQNNLIHYVKAGLGLDFIIEGALGLYKSVAINCSLMDEVYRRAEQIGTETSQHITDPSYLMYSSFVAVGGMLLASGIYNLVKNCMQEPKVVPEG